MCTDRYRIFSYGIIVAVALFSLFGCFSTATVQGPPPKMVKSGEAPMAAMLPILNANDAEIAEYVTQSLVQCLGERNVFQFVSDEAVSKAVADSGFDLSKTFGLKNSEYRQLAQSLGVRYTIHGVVTVRKTLTFAGWRKDVDAYIFVNDGNTGKKVESFRSMTDFTFGKTETVINAEEMGRSVANHTCAKMISVDF